MVQRPRLPGAVMTAVVFLWINVAIGIFVLLSPGTPLIVVPWMVADAAVAIGLVRRTPIARGMGLLISGAAYLLGLTGGMFISTNLVIFVALLLPRAARYRDQADMSVIEGGGTTSI